MKLYLDPGHGGSDAGASGNGLKEKDITLAIALHIRSILTSDYKEIEIKMSRTTDKTINLKQRTDEANNWGADYLLSIHCNSFNGSAQGFEDYIYEGLSDSSQTASYQDTMHKSVMKQSQLNDRGQKKDNLHVLRESAMPALLTENGFIDNKQDAVRMKDDSWRKRIAQGHVDGLKKAFHLQRKKKKSDKKQTMYKVIAGSFQKQSNAKTRVDLLQDENIEAITILDKQWHCIQAGAFTNRKKADIRLKKVKQAGVKDAYVVKENK